ncbi:MAG: BamA/TamA family outer membrane protein [Bacteroidales bacterium]|nr:BamA/TamA family outer membrane protein [Bacteroidales bacterium]
MRNIQRIIVLILFIGFSLNANAAKKDSTKVRKNLRFSLLGGPGYTPDYGFVIGGSALFTFSTNKEDSTLKRSVIPVAFGYMFNGGGSAFIRPQLFFNEDKFRVFGVISANNTLENYYGVGYETNSSKSRVADSTQYRSIGFNINPILLFRFKETPLYIGASLSIKSTSMNEVSIGVLNDKDYIAQGGGESGLHYTNIGLGLNASYDTRDVPANAYSGLLVETSATFYSTQFGSSTSYSIYTLTYKQYEELKFIGERKVLAWILDGRFATGNIPLTELSMLGSAFDLRGYYMGQFRDKNAVTVLMEYRHMFNMGDETWMRRLSSKMGFVVWGGFGTINPDKQLRSNVLPNYGLGFRIEVQPRMNFRVDIGRDPINQQTLLYFNVTEAF